MRAPSARRGCRRSPTPRPTGAAAAPAAAHRRAAGRAGRGRGHCDGPREAEICGSSGSDRSAQDHATGALRLSDADRPDRQLDARRELIVATLEHWPPGRPRKPRRAGAGRGDRQGRGQAPGGGRSLGRSARRGSARPTMR
jgi:hypothetical protein